MNRSLFQRFTEDQRGTIAIIFAFTMLVIVTGVGIAVDFGRSFNAATRLRAAADAAALAGAKLLDEGVPDAKIELVANQYFQNQIVNLSVAGVTSSPLTVEINRGESSVGISADVEVKTTLAKIMNIGEVEFEVQATAIYKVKKVELAMVLDVTGSMNNGGRLSGLKAAAHNIIDTLVNDSNGKHNRIALVPYSAAVNVGPDYRFVASGGASLDGCVIERLLPTARDTDEVTGGGNNFAVEGQLISGTSGRYVCPDAVLLPLSKDAATLKSTIDSYAASGWTAGHIGLAWGWNTISPNWNSVFTGDKEPGPYDDDNYVKAVLLMTDGSFNTAYTSGESEAEQKAESETRTLALCNNMKARKIQIYTVAFDAPPEAQTLLQSCASALSNFFNATDSTQLNAAFQTIADNLRSMRLAQ